MKNDNGIQRRSLMLGAGLSAFAAPAVLTGLSSGAARAQESEAMPVSDGPKSESFSLGNFKILVVEDGSRVMDNPGETFGTGQDPETVSALLEKNFLPADRMVNGFAPVLVDTGDATILFDTGMGAAGRSWGAGRLVEGLRANGYQPEDIDVVVITHMHGDHIMGLMEDGAPTYPNARYVFGDKEYAFWSDEARMGTPAEGGHESVKKLITPLAEKATFINGGDSVAPGIEAMEAFGHTPGHLIFMLESNGEQLVLTADTANHYVLSLQRPDWHVRFDMDPEAAAKSRRAVFDMIAAERLPFIGYHMPFPSVGYVEKSGDGYVFMPKTYQFRL
ncbi:MBL fold metallo-hydrolase [Martelella mediterranea]|uniref:Glyoxylase-like metal-dependent hydrolase (Beta-lactamase superfamily II) n=1 Tax=Martelella mediterranea TaxID=293089 RepID=A0A4R3NPF9_9HYPH|nr:MBL fold metallo-hydrolase [Martelella mediterranea]TCT37631.1 glyoxylase-like metal-dependent hydrolase (beta-lactamase superfamily II) [Martelella mediterranea]